MGGSVLILGRLRMSWAGARRLGARAIADEAVLDAAWVDTEGGPCLWAEGEAGPLCLVLRSAPEHPGGVEDIDDDAASGDTRVAVRVRARRHDAARRCAVAPVRARLDVQSVWIEGDGAALERIGRGWTSRLAERAALAIPSAPARPRPR
ncbi:MAG: hypothetical protein H6983_06230 [Ectothiorhodospiraceae bacterium]|nr:hypothetical protein [Chromatiales bacterium]MCP5153742.1 hypothetical protein [Ectothiorhodospiraceae bacterium]